MKPDVVFDVTVRGWKTGLESAEFRKFTVTTKSVVESVGLNVMVFVVTPCDIVSVLEINENPSGLAL